MYEDKQRTNDVDDLVFDRTKVIPSDR